MTFDIHATRGWTKPYPEGIKIHYESGDYTATVIWNGELGFEAFVYRPDGEMVTPEHRFRNQLLAQLWAEEEIKGAMLEFSKSVDEEVATNPQWGMF